MAESQQIHRVIHIYKWQLHMDFYFIFHKWSTINRTDFNMKQEQAITGEEIQAEMVDYC